MWAGDVAQEVSLHHDCFGCEKSKRRAIDRLTNSSPGLVNFLFSLFVGAAFTFGPVELTSMFPSISSRFRDAAALPAFGNLDGWDG